MVPLNAQPRCNLWVSAQLATLVRAAQRQRQFGTTLDVFVLHGIDVQEGAHARPNTLIMCPSIRSHRLALHHTQK